MRVLQIVNSLTHTSIPIEMACEMMKLVNVEIAALYNSQAEADQFAKEMGIKCKIYGFGYKNDKFNGLKRYIHFLKICTYDIIHTHHSLSGTLARLYCYKKRGIKMVHTVHANYHSYSKGQNLLIGITLNRTDAVAFNSKSSQDGLYYWEKKRIRRVKQQVIYNGVNVERIKEASDDFWKSFCSEHGIDDDKIIITQIGRLEPVKNPMGSLRGFAKLKGMIDSALWNRLCFVYMGNGSEMGKMQVFIKEQGIEDKVFLPGVIERDNVYSWMKRANLLVIPSHFEGFCNTLVEGMVAGIPVVISDIPVFREIIDNSLSICRFEQNNDSSIADVLHTEVKSMMDDYEEQLIKQVKYASSKFGLDSTIKRYIKLYSSIC